MGTEVLQEGSFCCASSHLVLTFPRQTDSAPNRQNSRGLFKALDLPIQSTNIFIHSLVPHRSPWSRLPVCDLPHACLLLASCIPHPTLPFLFYSVCLCSGPALDSNSNPGIPLSPFSPWSFLSNFSKLPRRPCGKPASVADRLVKYRQAFSLVKWGQRSYMVQSW